MHVKNNHSAQYSIAKLKSQPGGRAVLPPGATVEFRNLTVEEAEHVKRAVESSGGLLAIEPPPKLPAEPPPPPPPPAPNRQRGG